MAIFDTLLNIVRPRWKHSNPEVRVEAIRREDNERVAAEALRRDEDVRVRRVALKKVSDPDVLAHVAEADADESLRKAAAEKATEVLVARAVAGDDAALSRLRGAKAIAEVARTAAGEGIRRAALGRLSEEKSFIDVAKNANDPATRRLAVDKIYDGMALRDIAIHEAAKDVGIAAVEKIDESELLETVAKRAKSKAVREAARERLPQAMGKVALTTRPTPRADSHAHARQAQIVREIDQLSGSSAWAETAAHIAGLRTEWEQLGPADAESRKKLERTAGKFEARRRAHAETLRAHTEAEQAQQRRTEAEEKQLDAAARMAADVEALDGEAIPDGLARARDAFRELGRLPPRGKDVETRFQRACDAAAKRLELGLVRAKLSERLDVLALEAEAITGPFKEAESKLKGLARKLRDLESAGVDEAIRARFARVEEGVQAMREEERARREAEEAQAITRLEELCARLEGLAADQDAKHVEHELKVALGAFESAGGGVRGPKGQAVRDRFQAARDKTVARLGAAREAQDWKKWANVPLLEKLCERIEALKQVADAKEASAQLKELQKEWKKVGPAPKERSEQLWARFKAAGDEVYQKSHEGFEKLDAERGDNLKKKEELCARAEALVEAHFGGAAAQPTPASPPDGPTASTAPPAAPIPPPPADATATAVDPAAIPPANSTATPPVSANDAAEAGGSEKRSTADQIKALQQEWKAIGPVPKEAGDALWRRFRASCDRFFEQRKEVAGKDHEERGENLKRLEALIAQVTALADSTDWKGAADEIKAAQAEWKTVGPAARKESEAAWAKFREACDRFFERRKAHFDRLDGERADNQRKKEALCLKVEEIVAALDAPDSKKGRDEAMKEAKALQFDWKKVGPAPRETADELWARFRGACDKIFQRPQDSAPTVEELPAPEGDPATWPKFANKINLEGIIAKIQGDGDKTG